MSRKYQRLAVLAGLTMVFTPIVINAVGIDHTPAPPTQHFTDAEPGPVTPRTEPTVTPKVITKHVVVIERVPGPVSPAKSPSPQPVPGPTTTPKPTKPPVSRPGPKCDPWPGGYQQATYEGGVASWICVYPPRPPSSAPQPAPEPTAAP